ncbi:MAG: hypothetical protein RLZZ387_4343 [Chloroflexota bacterium]
MSGTASNQNRVASWPGDPRRGWSEASLRAKTLVIVGVTVAALLVLISIPLRLFVLDSFLQLEQRQVSVDVDRAANALADDMADLAQVAAGYGTRDDTYAFAASGDHAYIEHTLSNAALADSRISLFVLADAEGSTVYGKALDLASGDELVLPNQLRERVPPALLPGTSAGRRGILALPSGLMLVSSHPVLTSDRGGPPRGIVVVGRVLDTVAVRELAATTRLQLTVHRLDAAYPSPDVVAARDELAALPTGVVRPIDQRQIAGYRLLTDMDGRPAAVLRVQSPRTVYAQGQASVAAFTLALLLAAAVSGGVALALLERSVVARQTRLSAAVRSIGEGGDLAARVAVDGGDEIARLGGAINAMLGSLERAQSERREAYAQLTLLTDQLRRSRDILRTLFDGMDDGLALMDGEGTVLAANQRLATLLGETPEDVVGLPVWAIDAPASAEPVGLAVRGTLSDGQPRRERITHDEGGRHSVLDLQVLPLLDATSAVDQAVVHVTDVTERLRLEAAAIQSERFTAGARLAAAVAHELNTPLQSIQSCLDLVRVSAADQRDIFLTIAQEEIRRIGGIVGSLLAVHRPGDGPPAPLDLNPLVERLLLLTGGALGDRKVYVERDLAHALPPVTARADQLTQVLLNLVMNAADAMPQGGTITIRTALAENDYVGAGACCDLAPTRGLHGSRLTAHDSRLPAHDSQLMPHGSRLSLTISDTGPGVPDVLRGRIFDPFFTTKPDGSGLGLAISRQIIVDHGGAIEVGRAPGGGAVFTIELPVTAPVSAAEKA